MTNDAQAAPVRPAADTARAVAALILQYPPLVQSRHWFTYEVDDSGTVTLQGNIKSAVAERLLLGSLPRIPGVTAIQADDFYSDETVRLAVGRVLPPGVRAAVDYGIVVLSGELPPRFKAETLARSVLDIPGVRAVKSKISGDSAEPEA